MTTVRLSPSGEYFEITGLPEATAAGEVLFFDGTNWTAVASGAQVVDQQDFQGSSGTWIKPSGNVGGQLARVRATGPGGAGGGGRGDTAATTRAGGSGGAGGATEERWFLLSELPASVPVTCNPGGVPGTGGTLADGTDGTGGGIAAFGDLVIAFGGGAGQGGSTADRSGGGGGGTMSVGGPGGGSAVPTGGRPAQTNSASPNPGFGGSNVQTTTTPNVQGVAYWGGTSGGFSESTGPSQRAPANSRFGASGGGGGGRVSSGGASTDGTEGGTSGPRQDQLEVGGGAAGGVADGGDGADGADGGLVSVGGGGGGGAGHTSGTGGTGGAGGFPGGGGGGGGGGFSAGGDGGPGGAGRVCIDVIRLS